MLKYILLSTLLHFCTSMHRKIISDIIKTVYIPQNCLYLIGSRDLVSETLKYPEIPFLVGSIPNPNLLFNCHDEYIRIEFAETHDQFRHIFQFEEKPYPFHAFSTILVVTDIVEVNDWLLDAVERHSVQGILIDKVKSGEIEVEILNLGLKLVGWGDEIVYDDNLRVLEDFQKVRFGGDIGKQKIQASVFSCPPFFYKSNEQYNGIEHLLLSEVIEAKYLEYVYYESYKTDDLWRRVASDVETGATDIGMCSQWLTVYKNQDKTMTIPYTQLCATFLAPKPYQLPYSMYVIFPLSIKVWYLIIFCTILTILVLYLHARLNQVMYPHFKSPYTSFAVCVLHILRLLSQGSLSNLPSQKYPIFRWLLIFWSTYTLLITTGYSAGFTSLLATPRYSKVINSLSDFIGEQIHWGASATYYVDELKSSNDTTISQIADLFILEDSIETKNKRLHQRNYATLVKKVMNKYVTDADRLDEGSQKVMRVMQDCLENYNVIITLRKNSPLKKRFDRKILQLVESGLLKFWISQMSKELEMSHMKNFFTTSINEISTELVPLSLNTTQGFFYFLIGGLVFACVVFIVEVYYNRFTLRKPFEFVH